MAKPIRGEIWRVDLGLTAKVRPCLVMSDYPADDESRNTLMLRGKGRLNSLEYFFACWHLIGGKKCLHKVAFATSNHSGKPFEPFSSGTSGWVSSQSANAPSWLEEI